MGCFFNQVFISVALIANDLVAASESIHFKKERFDKNLGWPGNQKCFDEQVTFENCCNISQSPKGARAWGTCWSTPDQILNDAAAVFFSFERCCYRAGPVVAYPGNSMCWDGQEFTWNSCCDPQRFSMPGGNEDCWLGDDFTFENCCFRDAAREASYETLSTPSGAGANSDGIHEFVISAITSAAENPHSPTWNVGTSDIMAVTDKVRGAIFHANFGHRYDVMYGIYLKPLRDVPIKMLEIGLGCTMDYGAGASAALWQDWFTHPDFELYTAEFDEECVAENRKMGRLTDINILLGDQGDARTVAMWAKEVGSGIDVVVDDGSHEHRHVKTSFTELWPHLRPGGLYFIEDLHAGRANDMVKYRFEETGDVQDIPFIEIIQAWIGQLVQEKFDEQNFRVVCEMRNF